MKCMSKILLAICVIIVFSAYTLNEAQKVDGDMVAKIRDAGSRVAVLGATHYSSAFYKALAANAKGGAGLIVRFGVGYDSVNLDLCREHNVMLAITTGALHQSVAEHALALILSAAGRIPFMDRQMRSGGFKGFTRIELQGKPLSIAGFGIIGRTLARIAAV